MTFGADYGVLWRIQPDSLELLAIDPPRSERPRHGSCRSTTSPGCREAIRELGTSFVAGRSRDDARRGARVRSTSSESDRLCGHPSSSPAPASSSWRSPGRSSCPSPIPATVAVVRRFADQAGLALEQLERRRAEAEAALRADSTRRLQEVTAALSLAATPLDVSNTCLEHALASIGAEAGFVVLNGPDGTTVELVAATGLRRRRARGLARTRSWTTTSRSLARWPRARRSGRSRREEMSAFASVHGGRALRAGSRCR